MTLPLFSEMEIRCIKKLAELFEKGQPWVDYHKHDPLDLPVENRDAILSTLEHWRIITEIKRSIVGIILFRITPITVQYSRELTEVKKESEMDIVDQLKSTVRRKPATAWLLLIFLGATAIITFLNQLLSLLKTLGFFK